MTKTIAPHGQPPRVRVGAFDVHTVSSTGMFERLRETALCADWRIQWQHQFPNGYHLGLRRDRDRISMTFHGDGILDHFGFWREQPGGEPFRTIDKTLSAVQREREAVHNLTGLVAIRMDS